ncbi:hypothetical protein [Anaeromyxobacter oryzae]|uniref:Lipoprotein n=1 Tax=Anaeromyxobacter oryzae TaxID=2918170 RepID=A0ABN6MTH6_9BACT|nr:hypothetical protein [Anaeromyxobacter oryzae]BDG03610.1 hypothetical protein AMOR_26060 [Anaeromyxobacter oryzae]
MRPALAVLVAALSLAACKGPCQELGNRLCRCVGSGTTRDTCERQVQNQISSANPGKDVEDICSARLDTCIEPQGADFCAWVQTECGKASCGLSVEDFNSTDVCPKPAPATP